jgi:hypothetical protein
MIYVLLIVPIVATVKLQSLLGRVIIYGPPDLYSRFSMSFLELPKCTFDFNVKAGSHQKYDLMKIYKVEDFFISMLKKLLWKNTVAPNRITFALPLPGKKLDVRTNQYTSREKHKLGELDEHR